MKAIISGTIVAESDQTVVIESNHYFPRESVRTEFLVDSPRRSICPWKGEAHYFHVVVDRTTSKNAAWTYPQPKEEAKQIAGYIAFWKDVQITP